MRRTDAMTVTLARPGMKPRVFTVPASIGHEVESLIRRGGKTGRSVRAEVVLPELADDTLRPAAVLRGSRQKENLTQTQLAARLDIPQGHVSEMENGKRPIGKMMAKKLADVFDCDYRMFL